MALSRRLIGELVSPTLKEEGGIDEGVIVHANELVYLSLALPHRVSSDGFKAVAIAYLKLQVRRPLPRSTHRAGMATNNPVASLPCQKIQLHLHLVKAVVDEVVLALAPGPYPTAPR